MRDERSEREGPSHTPMTGRDPTPANLPPDLTTTPVTRDGEWEDVSPEAVSPDCGTGSRVSKNPEADRKPPSTWRSRRPDRALGWVERRGSRDPKDKGLPGELGPP